MCVPEWNNAASTHASIEACLRKHTARKSAHVTECPGRQPLQAIHMNKRNFCALINHFIIACSPFQQPSGATAVSATASAPNFFCAGAVETHAQPTQKKRLKLFETKTLIYLFPLYIAPAGRPTRSCSSNRCRSSLGQRLNCCSNSTSLHGTAMVASFEHLSDQWHGGCCCSCYWCCRCCSYSILHAVQWQQTMRHPQLLHCKLLPQRQQGQTPTHLQSHTVPTIRQTTTAQTPARRSSAVRR